MEKTYNPQDIETKWYSTWETNNYFKPSQQGDAYCIMLPPPNVTGSLHMGHGFQHTLMDALIRYHRMCGENVLWQGGTDHAGIATQMVVERQLAQQKQTRHDLGREKFLEKVWEWKQESGGTITKQMRRMGASTDWSRESFTMDPDYAKAVEQVFISLYRESLIYRGKRLVNWDPHLLTAISDLEVISTEEQGSMWYIHYPLAEGTGHITVATTRPETLLGDVAVAVSPDDERYQAYIGHYLKLPLTDRTIPIIADDTVDPAFGTGCVKITPAHDFNDYAMGQRHQLPQINIFTPEALLNENAPKAYQGLERFAARKKIVADLEQQNLLEKIEPHTLKIPRGDRSGVVIEPYLTDQWFMKMQPLAEPALQVVKNGEIKFHPENWSKTYFQWLENIEDWCISRQLWWGHRIPAWYDNQNNVYVGASEAEVREHYQLATDLPLQQDKDVLDTWFSSALWPFATLGWPAETYELKTFYPTSVLVTGFDIIFFWVARMVMLGLKFTGQVPFKDVYVTGLIRDHEGHKMSKSKGNVLDPIDLIDGIDLSALIAKRTSGLMQPQMAKKIEQATQKQFPNGIPAFGTDALRITYCALASPTRDIRFDLGRIDGYRNFCNKLWNAARFVLMNVEDKLPTFDAQAELSVADHWIRSHLQKTIQQIHSYFKDYRFDLLTQTIYEFIWNEYCDWYLELTKPVTTQATANTLIYVLENVLRLLHPLMPFITEEIWQRIAPLANKTGKTIMLERYPECESAQINEHAEAEINWLKHIVTTLRTMRSEIGVSPGKKITLLCNKGNVSDKQRILQHQTLIMSLAKVESIQVIEDATTPAQTAMGLVGELQLLIPMAGLIDVAAETKRLEKELEKLQKELEKANNKLSNENFVKSAPAQVVTQERERLADFQSAIAKLTQQLQNLQKI
jgi:valyl-tRNA synthetase